MIPGCYFFLNYPAPTEGRSHPVPSSNLRGQLPSEPRVHIRMFRQIRELALVSLMLDYPNLEQIQPRKHIPWGFLTTIWEPQCIVVLWSCFQRHLPSGVLKAVGSRDMVVWESGSEEERIFRVKKVPPLPLGVIYAVAGVAFCLLQNLGQQPRSPLTPLQRLTRWKRTSEAISVQQYILFLHFASKQVLRALN